MIDFEDATMFPSDHEEWHLDRSIKERLRVALDTLQLETCKDHLRRIRQQMVNGRLTEQAVRKTYIRILEMINAHFPTFQYSNEEERTPYEELLAMETIEAIHAYIERFLEAGFNHIEQLQPDQKSYVEQAVDIIMKRYAENISLHSVADQINVNRSYLSRMFKKETGENFTTFLTKVRIEKAKYYLNAGNLKVYEIAEKVGYLNYTYFSKIFKKVVGMSPEEYRG